MLERLLGRGFQLSAGPAVTTDDAASNPNAFEQFLEGQLDRLRDAAKTGDPAEYLRRLREFHDDLPSTASGTLRFRAKANVGHRYLALGQGDEAARWLLEAYDAAPEDGRAIANRTLGLWISGKAQEAYEYGIARLREDPANAALASYLPQIAVMVPDVDDGLQGIPEALLDNEEVVVGQAVFLRGRDRRPEWYEWSRSNATRFPESRHLRLMAVFADLDEVARDEEANRTQILTTQQRERLAAAADVLDAYWQAKQTVLHNRFDDAPHALVGAMICYHFLQDGRAAVERATRIADEGLDEKQTLANAVQVALSYGRVELARRLIALAPEDGDLLFQSGILAVQGDQWDEAREIFSRSSVPPTEQRVVDTINLLADVKARRPGALGIQEVLDQTLDSSRGLVLVARVATELGDEETASKALAASLSRLGPETHIATRLMVGAYAAEFGSPTDVIKAFDGFLPNDGYHREQAALAAAHANERPHHKRNLAYFERLPLSVRARREIARAHASVLTNINRLPDALVILRRLYDEDPTDAFVAIRLLDVLQRLGDEKGHARLLRQIEPIRLEGPPDFIMAVLGALAKEGLSERAYPVAYDLVRKHPEMPSVAFGYVGLGLFGTGLNPCFRQSVAGRDAFVKVRGPEGDKHGFVIDDGPAFLGISVEAPGKGRATLVEGKRKGGTYTVRRMGGEVDEWQIASVRSKYLYLHQFLSEEFEVRYPGQPGIARYTVGKDDISQLLAVVRRGAEENARRAQVYVDSPIPLAAVARSLGGDPVSFSRYLAELGHDIATCEGSDAEREKAADLVQQARGGGVALDPFTTIVAAELGLLPALKEWFGTLHVPDECLVMVDKMIVREREGLGRKQMTVAFRNGEYWREEVNDEKIGSRITALSELRDQVTAQCTTLVVLVPDETSTMTDALLELGGDHLMDAAFLAGEKVVPLLSDDLRYRMWASQALGRSGFWLQAVLIEMVEADALSFADYCDAVVGLSARHHGHVSISANVLYEICRRDADQLHRLRAVLHFIGNPTAEMVSHAGVVRQFVGLLWGNASEISELRRRAATGATLEALLAHRKSDWSHWLGTVQSVARRGAFLDAYFAEWRRGHFLTPGILRSGQSGSTPATGTRRRQRKTRK